MLLAGADAGPINWDSVGIDFCFEKCGYRPDDEVVEKKSWVFLDIRR